MQDINTEYKVEVNQENAKQVLIDESLKRPVLVDFWADWCGPCKSLMPILDKLAEEYQGAFLLAKLNADEQPMLAGQFGVQSLPTLILMKDGQPVDGLMGAQPETEIRSMLEKYLPKPWDSMLEQAQELLVEDKVNDAIPLLSQAYKDSSERADIAVVLAEAYIKIKRFEEAKKLLDAVRMVDQDAEFERVKAHWELAQNADKAPEISALEEKHAANPDDIDVAFQLAVQYSEHSYHKEALELLYSLLQKSLNAKDGEARKIFTDVLAVLGKGDPLAAEYQRKLYSLIY